MVLFLGDFGIDSGVGVLNDDILDGLGEFDTSLFQEGSFELQNPGHRLMNDGIGARN